MKCQAKIRDEFGGKYICLKEAAVKVTIIKADKNIKHSKCLCLEHRSRYVARYRYQAKYCFKPCEILEEIINKPEP